MPEPDLAIDQARPAGQLQRPDAPGPMTVNLAGIPLQSPIVLAAGTAGYADEILEVLSPGVLGAVTSKSITALPRDGHPTWRMVPLRGAMLNAIGLANTGVERFARHVANSHTLEKHGVALFASVAGDTIESYVRVAAEMDGLEGVRAIELNVSCPNVHGGSDFGVDPVVLADLVDAVRQVVIAKPLIVKLPPVATGLPNIVTLARTAVEARGRPGGPNARPGADVLCLANTTPAMAIDVRTRRPRITNTTGGLSGPAVHHIVVKLIHDTYRKYAKDVGVPIIGLGGVTRWQDAAQFILAGASAVGMGTATMADPSSPARVYRGLERWQRRMGAATIRELVGAVDVV